MQNQMKSNDEIKEMLSEYLSVAEEYEGEALSEQEVGLYLLCELPVIEWFETHGTPEQQNIVKQYLETQLRLRKRVETALSKRMMHLQEWFYEESHEGDRARREFLCCLRDLEKSMRFDQLFAPPAIQKALSDIECARRDFMTMCEEELEME